MTATTYSQIASDFRLGREAIDPNATMTQAEFDAMPVDKGVALLVDAFGPEPKSIKQIVSEALEGQTQAYLEDVSAHGIHNVTNNYHGDSDDTRQVIETKSFIRNISLLSRYLGA